MKYNNIKEFDLNIEKVLENWEIYHALREIIANAIDEQILSKTKDIKISKNSKGKWCIRDFGRGLKNEHLTQNECEEKLQHPELVIGKFGVGLKDALATLDRNKVKVLIKSKYTTITLGKSPKHGFEDINTLHAFISEPDNKKFVGTEFIFDSVSENEINLAKNLFLKFSKEEVLEETIYGQILKKKNSKSNIYINGVKVAEEENFIFSYNITSITTKIRKSLNRERTNVGRTAYTDRIKAILLDCKSEIVAKLLVDDLERFEVGDLHDELKWTDISFHASKLLNNKQKSTFVTSKQLQTSPDLINQSREDGSKIVVIPETLRDKICSSQDYKGNRMRDLNEYRREYNESFEYEFIKEPNLSEKELKIFKRTEEIISLIGKRPSNVREILISKSMRPDFTDSDPSGVWESHNNRIIIKKSMLKNLESYSGTLLHEIAHASSRAEDSSREFENELTEFLGKIANKVLRK